MFTDNQVAILRLLAGAPERTFSMSEVGRLLEKAPGVFQRGLNSLEDDGFIMSTREANLRLLRYNTRHPLHEAVASIVLRNSSPLPSGVYINYQARMRGEALKVAEPPGTYETSALKILIIAGPNGAGKTTFAREYLPREAGCLVFINADYIAHGLSPFSPELVALKAGKLMVRELDDHTRHRRSVAVETTLTGRRFARLIPRWQEQGYAVKLVFLSLPSVELALARVESRVRQGGHSIPEKTVRRRFDAGKRNFEAIYKQLVDAWAIYDNSGEKPILVEEEEK